MAEPPAGPLAARFELVMSELLARQAAALNESESPGAVRTDSAATPTTRTDATPTLPPVRTPLAGPPAPRPLDLGLPASFTLAAPAPAPDEGSVATATGTDKSAAFAAAEPGPSSGRTGGPPAPAGTGGMQKPFPSPAAAGNAEARMILDLARALQPGTTPAPPEQKTPAARFRAEDARTDLPRDAETVDAPIPDPVRRAAASALRALATSRTEAADLRAPDTSGPEPESAIRPQGRFATEIAAQRPATAETLPKLDPAGLALELALMVNAEMHKGWPAERFLPLLEKPRPPAKAIDLEEEPAEDESGEDDDEERSAGYEALLAYISEHAASRRLKRTLFFALGCYCALLNTLASEILEYFADEVDEEIGKTHDRA